jgi:hypothetical protein
MPEIPVNYRGFLVRRTKGGFYVVTTLNGRQVGGVYTSPTGARAFVDRQLAATSRV